MESTKVKISKHLNTYKYIVVAIGILLSYINPQNVVSYMLFLIAFPLNLIPAIDALYLLKPAETSTTDTNTYCNQVAIHHLTYLSLIILTLFINVHDIFKRALIMASLIFLTIEGVRHLIHSFFSTDPTYKKSHFLRFILKLIVILLLLPLLYYALL